MLRARTGKRGYHNGNSPSLDRIIPILGYVPGNIRIISLRANQIKNDATLEELELILIDAKQIRIEQESKLLPN